MKWGILGTSFISGVMADAITGDSGSELYAVAGRNQVTLDEFAEQHNVEHRYNSMDALLDDAEVEVVYIALPNHLHHEYVIKAAERGKAILCEKSLSVDMAKTKAALDAVNTHKVFFAEGLMYLNHPLMAAIVEEIKSGSIGDVRTIQASYVAAISEFVNPASKGSLYNLGCYPISLMHLVLQQAFGDELFDGYSVHAIGRRGRDGNICESSAMFKFSENLTAQVHTAEEYGLKHSFRILGSKGCIELNTNPWLPTQQNEYTVEIYETSQQVKSIKAEGDGFHYQVRNIRRAIESGALELKRPSATTKDSYQIMKLLTDWELQAK